MPPRRHLLSKKERSMRRNMGRLTVEGDSPLKLIGEQEHLHSSQGTSKAQASGQPKYPARHSIFCHICFLVWNRETGWVRCAYGSGLHQRQRQHSAAAKKKNVRRVGILPMRTTPGGRAGERKENTSECGCRSCWAMQTSTPAQPGRGTV